MDDNMKEFIGTALCVPVPKWDWYVFGGNGEPNSLLLVTLCVDVPLWRRVLTRIFLGSQWVRKPAEPGK